jgi:DNA-binding MarR family transcriptional regulator
LAEHLGVTPPTSSASVERLVKLGLVTRAPDPEERRRAVLKISREGAALLSWTEKQMKIGLRAELKTLSQSEIREIRAALATLTDVLGEP